MCSDALSLKLDWLRNILIAMIVTTLIDLLRLDLQPVLDLALAHYWYFIMQLAYDCLTNYLVMQAIWQPSRFTGLQYYLDQQQQITLNKKSAEPIFTELGRIILTEKLLKQPRFSLQDLAEITGLSSKDVSWAINDGCQLNFCDLIKTYDGLQADVFSAISKAAKENNLQVAGHPLFYLSIDDYIAAKPQTIEHIEMLYEASLGYSRDDSLLSKLSKKLAVHKIPVTTTLVVYDNLKKIAVCKHEFIDSLPTDYIHPL
jgi:hypothetical protein